MDITSTPPVPPQLHLHFSSPWEVLASVALRASIGSSLFLNVSPQRLRGVIFLLLVSTPWR
jgi:hypothetical protein